MLVFLQINPMKISWLPLQKICPRRASGVKNKKEGTKFPGRKKFQYKPCDSKNLQETSPSTSLTLWSPYLEINKTLTNQAKNLVFQQGLLWIRNWSALGPFGSRLLYFRRVPQKCRNLESNFVAVLALLAFASPAQAELINHTYWTYIPNPLFYYRYFRQ